jgi:hypothetical protein
MYSSEVAEYSATYICCLMLLVLASQKDSISHSGGASLLKLGGGRDNVDTLRGSGACSPGKILKSGIPEMQFPAFSGYY